MIKTVKDFKGKEFKNKRAMCQEYGCSYDAFRSRINKLKWDLESALTVPVITKYKKSHKIFFEEKEYSSFAELCRAYNISEGTARERMDRGYTTKEALTMPLKDGRNAFLPTVDHGGRQYASFNAMCKTYGLNQRTVHSRIQDYGWSLEKALTTPLGHNAASRLRRDKKCSEATDSGSSNYT